MFKIKGPILAAIDLDHGSDDLLRQADALARFYNVKFSACHVLPEVFAVRPLFPQLHLDDALKSSELETAVRNAVLERIRTVTTREAPQAGIEIEQGTVHAGILRAAERIGAGAVVVGEKVDPNGLHILGNAAEHIVRYAHCPVLVARPSPDGNVLAATDFSDPALPAVEAGAAEARRLKADMTIIHVVDLLPVMNPYYGEFFGLPPMDLSDRMRKLWQSKLEECVQHFKAEGGGLLRDGSAASAILGAASELSARLIVVGTHGRTGLGRVALGSVAEAVVRVAPCSVLIVRFA
jgi:nucleotide-binding universal stress UspA family protein